jgi:hypothetical protein
MRTEQEILAAAVNEPPFSNGTEGYGWMENWCWRPCMNPVEKAWRDYEDGKRKHPMKGYESGCPLLLAALYGKTPTEWLKQDSGPDQYHCIEFRGPDDGGGDDPFGGPPAHPPRAKREPKDMDGLFPRPERRVRMLKQPEPELVPV